MNDKNDSGELNIWAAGAMLHGMRAALHGGTGKPASPVHVFTDHGHEIARRVEEGDLDADVILIPDAMIDALASAGCIDAGLPRIALGKVPIGVVLHARHDLPDVATVAALRQAIAAAEEVALTTAPSGLHLQDVFARLGILASIEKRVVRFDTISKLNAHVAASPRFVLGFGPATEIIVWCDRGLAYAGPLPDAIQDTVSYSAAALARCRKPEAAEALLRFLQTEPTRRAFAASGVI